MGNVLGRDRMAVIGADGNDPVLPSEEGDVEQLAFFAVPHGIGEQILIQPDELVSIALDHQRPVPGVNAVAHTGPLQDGYEFLGQLLQQIAEIYRILAQR
ncbi:hypothetical protein D3C73_1508550 [compost metagenome]